MPGSKTRFGFAGASDPLRPKGNGPENSRAARTIIGHETHRPGEAFSSGRAPKDAPKVESQLVSPTPEPAPAVPETIAREEVTERVRDRTERVRDGVDAPAGKSRLPAIARLLGRWTTGGRFLSRSRMLASEEPLPELPRNVWPSRIAIFLGAALLSFLIALAIMKVGRLG